MGRRKKIDSKLVCLRSSRHVELLTSMLKDTNYSATDLTFICVGGQIEAHSFIMAHRSSLLRMALADFPKGFQYVVSLPGIRFEMVKCLISFLYTGSVVLIGKYVEAFQSVLDDLGIIAETEKTTAETNDSDISIFTPLADVEPEESDEELKYFVDLPLPAPKKRKSLLKLTSDGRKKRARIAEPDPVIEEKMVEEEEPEPSPENVPYKEELHQIETEEDISGAAELVSDGGKEDVDVISEGEDESENLPEERRTTRNRNSTVQPIFNDEDYEISGSDGEVCASGEAWQESEEDVDVGGEEKKKSRKKLTKNDKRPMKKVQTRKSLAEPDGQIHSCAICKAEYDTPKALYTHYVVHKRGDAYQCDICSQRFRNFSALAVHNRKHTGEKPFRCQYCEREFAHQASYDTHLNLHTGEKPYACKECGKGFHNRAGLYGHKCDEPIPEGVDPSFLRYECAECHRRFKSRVALGRHKAASHKLPVGDVTNLVLCELCGRGFTTPMLLKQHLRYHSDKRPFTCTVCNKGFFARTSLETHERSHGSLDWKYDCTVCNKKFKTPEILERHTRTLHTEEREHACEICTETFRLRSQLDNHMLLHTNSVKYQCHCGKLFLSPRYLHKHKLTHLRQVRCIYCRKAFITSQEREEHEALHQNGTLPITKKNPAAQTLRTQTFEYYECSVCAERFRTEADAQEHMNREHDYREEENGVVLEETTGEIDPVQTEPVYYNNEQVVVVSDQGAQQWPLHYIVMPSGEAEGTQVVTYNPI